MGEAWEKRLSDIFDNELMIFYKGGDVKDKVRVLICHLLAEQAKEIMLYDNKQMLEILRLKLDAQAKHHAEIVDGYKLSSRYSYGNQVNRILDQAINQITQGTPSAGIGKGER